MPITFIVPPSPKEPEQVRRCPVDGAPYGPYGVPTCNFLHNTEVFRVVGGAK